MKHSPVLPLFSPASVTWFSNTFSKPSDVQEAAWKACSSGDHSLITAPTGSGKTLAAFFWTIDRFVQGSLGLGATRVLYISPLRALNNDMERNLRRPLEGIWEQLDQDQPRIGVRSGDSTPNERRRHMSHPSEFFITTPETLTNLLISAGGRTMLSTVEVVIVDEIHALVGNHRGAQLTLCLERLVELSGEFQRIGVSATIGDIELCRSFLGGRYDDASPRPVSLAQSSVKKEYHIHIEPVPPQEPGVTVWEKAAMRIVELCPSNGSALVFANSRRATEKLAALVNQIAPPGPQGLPYAQAHHGALSKERRLEAELLLKGGRIPVIVCTNTLELGIDVGAITKVLMVQGPWSINTAIQRMGRAGHSLGQASIVHCLPLHPEDLLLFRALELALEGNILEPTLDLSLALDLLPQHILAEAIHHWPLDLSWLHRTLGRAQPFWSLALSELELAFQLLQGAVGSEEHPALTPRILKDENGELQLRAGADLLLYQSGGTIPDRGSYGLRISSTAESIGTLDEEFVFERKIGDRFTLGSQTWVIERITDQYVEVRSSTKGSMITPFWRGDPMGRSTLYMDLVGKARDQWAQGTIPWGEELLGQLSDYLARQQASTGEVIPSGERPLVEYSVGPGEAPIAILHWPLGTRLLRPLAQWTEGFFLRQGSGLSTESQVVFNDFGILVLLGANEFQGKGTFWKEALEKFQLNKEMSRNQWMGHVAKTSGFGMRFREHCGRALVVTRSGFQKRTPLWLTRRRSGEIMDQLGHRNDFLVSAETWSSVVHRDNDFDGLWNRTQTLVPRALAVAHSHHPSPMAQGLIFDLTMGLMYQYDQGLASPVNEDMSSQSPPVLDFPQEFLRAAQHSLWRLGPGRIPHNGFELQLYLRDMAILDREHVDQLGHWLADHPDAHEMLELLDHWLVPWEGTNSQIFRYRDLKSDSFAEPVARWLEHSIPSDERTLIRLFGEMWSEERAREWKLEGELVQVLIHGELRWVLLPVLQTIFSQWSRFQRPQIPPLPLEKLLFWFAHWSPPPEEDPGAYLYGHRAPISAWTWGLPLIHRGLSTNRHHFLYPSGHGRQLILGQENPNPLVVPKPQAPADDPLGTWERGAYTPLELAQRLNIPLDRVEPKLWKAFWTGTHRPSDPSQIFSLLARGADRKQPSFSTGADRKGSNPDRPWEQLKPGYSRRRRSRHGSGSNRPAPGSRASSIRWEPIVWGPESDEDLIWSYLDRYGIICRSLLDRDGRAKSWAHLQRLLYTMELRGELVAGLFFHGMGGIQYILSEDLEPLSSREFSSGQGSYWTHRSSPISLNGIIPRWAGSSSWEFLYIFNGAIGISATKDCGNIQVNSLPNLTPQGWAGAIEDLAQKIFSSELESMVGIKIARINGVHGSQHLLAPTMVELGWSAEGLSLRRWKAAH